MVASLADRLAAASATHESALDEAAGIVLEAPDLYLHDGEWAQRRARGGRRRRSARGGRRRGASPAPVASVGAGESGLARTCIK